MINAEKTKQLLKDFAWECYSFWANELETDDDGKVWLKVMDDLSVVTHDPFSPQGEALDLTAKEEFIAQLKDDLGIYERRVLRMNNNDLNTMFSHKTDMWATPQKFFDDLNEEFRFTLDPCADEFNHKCEKYYTEDDDGLSKDWSQDVVFCNPPYSKSKDWIKKASNEAKKGATVVMLIPARTDTKAWWEYIFNQPNVEIRFIKGRLKFGDGKNSAPFPSAVIVFRPYLQN